MKNNILIVLGVIVIAVLGFVVYLKVSNQTTPNINSELQYDSTDLTEQEIDSISRSIAALNCTTFRTDSGQGLPTFGTGTYMIINDPISGQDYSMLLTNGHVAEEPSIANISETKASCNIRFNNVDRNHYYSFMYSNDTTVENENYDFALLVPEKDNGIEKDNVLLHNNGQPLPICSELHIGKKVFVFGYPGSSSTFEPSPKPEGRVFSPDVMAWYDEIAEYSSTRNMVLTDGIISGHIDSDYYTTAKIDSGSSGGLVVSKENGQVCIAGVPTWVSIGEFENLGVIQPIPELFKSGIDVEKLSAEGFTNR